MHVRGYKEKGNIDTPLELAIRNQTDRYSLAIDAIDRIPSLHNLGSGAREKLLNLQIAAKNEAFENGIDPVAIREWAWPYDKSGKKTVENVVQTIGGSGPAVATE